MRLAALLLVLALPLGAAAQSPDYSPPRVRLMDGAATLPALTFHLDQDTGIYRSGANTMELVTNGATRLTIGAAHVTASGNVTAAGFIGVGLYASGEGNARLGVTVNGANASYSTTTLTGGVDLAHTFYTLNDFSAADKVLQWGDAGTTELGAIYGDGAMQLDGALTLGAHINVGTYVRTPVIAGEDGASRVVFTSSGKAAYTAQTALTGGEDLGHTFFVTTDFGAADKVLQWGDAGTVELGSCFGDGSCQFDGALTSDGTGTSDFDGPVTAPGFTPDKCDSTGTPGAATCNTYAGRAAIAAAAASVVITDSLVTATSSVFAQLATADGTCFVVRRVVPAAGSFTITVDAACTAAANVAWEVR